MSVQIPAPPALWHFCLKGKSCSAPCSNSTCNQLNIFPVPYLFDVQFNLPSTCWFIHNSVQILLASFSVPRKALLSGITALRYFHSSLQHQRHLFRHDSHLPCDLTLMSVWNALPSFLMVNEEMKYDVSFFMENHTVGLLRCSTRVCCWLCFSFRLKRWRLLLDIGFD